MINDASHTRVCSSGHMGSRYLTKMRQFVEQLDGSVYSFCNRGNEANLETSYVD